MPRPKKEQPNHAGGLYEVKITTGKALDGKLIRKSFYSRISKDDAKRQAEEWKIAQEVANRTGLGFVDKTKTFGQWAADWLEAKRGTVKPYTYQNTYKVKLDKYILPYFGQADISAIRPIDVQNFLNDHSQLSEDMLDTLRMILRSIFDSAIDNDLCYKNPAKHAKIKSTYQPEGRRVYSREQADKLYWYAVETGQLDIILLLKTGVRRSELLALKWNDVNFKNDCIFVRAAVTPSVHETVEGRTKSASGTRCIPVPKDLMDILKAVQDEGYIIPGESGNAFQSPTTYAKRYREVMQEAADNLSIPALTPHELRHPYVKPTTKNFSTFLKFLCRGLLFRFSIIAIYSLQKFHGSISNPLRHQIRYETVSRSVQDVPNRVIPANLLTEIIV